MTSAVIAALAFDITYTLVVTGAWQSDYWLDRGGIPRRYSMPDSELGFVRKPLIEWTGRGRDGRPVHYRVDEHGFRNAPGLRRAELVFIGDSYTEAGTIPDDEEMFQPRLGVTWDPKDDGTSVVRATAGIFAARIPGLSLASTRSTNGSIGQTLFRNSALTPILGPVPAYPNLIPQSEIGSPFLPDVFVFDKDFENPRTYAYSLSYESQFGENYTWLVKGNYAKTDHITRFINRNDARFGSPWSSGLPPGGVNGINTLTSVESTAKSRYWGVTVGANKRMTGNYSFQAYYTYAQDKSDDDNERDPFTFRYVDPRHLDRDQPPVHVHLQREVGQHRVLSNEGYCARHGDPHDLFSAA